MTNRADSLLVAVTGASGTIYAERFLIHAVQCFAEIALVVSRRGGEVAARELGWVVDFAEPRVLGLPESVAAVVRCYHPEDLEAPFASGSSAAGAMVVVPCSLNTAGRIAAGIADNLICRTAQVMLKEGQPLVLVPRESPLSLPALRGFCALAEAGAVIMPAMPAFYHRPQTILELVDFFAVRILDRLGHHVSVPGRWGETEL